MFSTWLDLLTLDSDGGPPQNVSALNPEDLRDEPTTSVAARKEEEGMEAALRAGEVIECGATKQMNSTRDLTTEWDAFSQTKAALQHIENKLEVAPISIAGLDSVMEKKPSISTTRKISRKDYRSSSQNKESCFRKPLRVTTLDSNVSKNGHVEFRQPLASFRESQWSPSCKTSCQLEAKRLKYKEAGNKAEEIAPENIVTPKVRKVATAPMAPSYKGFNPSEAKIRTPDGKVWCEEEFLNLSRELCRDLEFQLAEEDLPAIKIPTERKEKKGHKTVRKTQKIAQLSSPYFKSDGANTISTTSWRDGQRLAKKILGPVPKLEQSNTQILSSDRSEKDKSIKSVSSAQITETDCNMPVAVKPLTKCPERSWSKIRAKNNLKRKDAAPHNGGLGNHRVNKDFLPVEIRGILDDLQLDSVVQDSERRNEECQNQESEPFPFSRSHSPSKKKSDKVPISEDTQFILKKRYYDTDEVRQYIMRQQEERKKRQSEEKKAQKEATEQKNKRLKELYKKQKEAVASKTKTTSTSETVTKQLQETYSKLFLEQTLLENPALSVQEVQSKPEYQPSGESDKENKAQERPISASSSSDMSLSEPPHPLIRDNTLEPLRIHPEKLNSVAQIRNGPKPWEELVKGSPHSVINIFTKSYQLCGKESEEHAGQGPSTHRPLLPAMSPPDSIASYEDEFISSQGSGTSMDKKSTPEHSGTSSTSLKGELASKKLPYEHQTMELTHHSSRSPSSGSSRASTSSKRRGRKEKTESLNGFPNASLREESKVSPGSDYGLEQAKHLISSNTVSSREQEVNPDSDNSLEELSGHSLMSLPDKVRSPRTISSAQSPNIQKKMDPVGNTAEKHRSLNCPRNIASGSMLNPAFSDLSIGNNRTGTNILNGSMRFSPAGLQHRMSAELNYLSTIEESVHQISDIERVRGISLAQQESVSLALILKSQQQRHERDLTLLKLKAEQELLENQRNLEEAKQKAAQAHAESLHHLAHSHQEAAETLQETTSKIATHQLETALLTADTARQIREMTELARFQISDAVGNTAAPVTTLFDQEQKHNSAFIKQLKLRNMNRKADSITTPPDKEETNDSKHHDLHAFDSYSESSRSKAHYQSSSSSRQESPSSKEAKKLSHHEKPSSSIEEKAASAMNDSLQNNSIPSVPDERDSTSIATEYSLKFDESMTEDEIEEQSFRSLLPSESHRRINLKKRSHQVYSDEEPSPEKPTLSPIKELNLPFSGGQDSFSKFTMEMVRQYMREEEMRAAHQSSLLRLREKALKEKTKAELAWLEHQKRHLRDKGEDDKMPPIRKKQRGLLLKLQQEKAEIKRLQEANKAARKERQLILKQQEEIERICQTTMKLQEKLKSSGENKEHRSEDDKKQTHSSSPQPTDAEAYSPSSISSSDTSSIMQKLKKMRRRMDEKFLTKREQKLMQRRQHAEELLQWKQRLDAEEAEIRQIEKQALAAWEKELHKTKANKKGAGDQKSDQKETASEEDSSMPPCSCLNSESSVPEELSNLVVESAPSKVSEIQGKPGSLDHTITEEIVYTQELESAVSPGKPSPCKSSGSLSKQESNKQTQKSGGKQLSSIKSQDISYSWSDESLSMTQSETTSDQSDIESRIWALKDEVRKKKSVVYRLKKEQKKRLKEKLKAQEASLIKQLETYDEFIKKTEEELNRDLETTPTAKPQIKTPSTATEKPKIKPPPLHRSETSKSWKSLTDSERCRGSLESIAEHIDVVPSSEQSVSVNMKFTEAEIQSEKQSHTASAVLKTLRKSTAESDDLDSLLSNQELGAVQEKKLATNEQQKFLVVYELDEGEEVSSPDMCPRPESPVFGASGQEELAKRLAELEFSREFLNVLGDDQDWFDEDFGLSSHMLPQNQAEESAMLPKIKLPKVSPKPYEEPLAVPYVAEEVEELVHAAAEKLWKCKELGRDIQALSNPRDMNESPQNDDIETISKEIYKQAVFDLTREIFEEIFAEDPNLNQPLWMKPSRIISGYFRRVKDPSDLEEIKVFITTEVLKLLNLRKESNNKTDWQKMMKFGRKKKDRVDHILVQELHEEEAQWVNYDEDELYVKMQLADGIFEALIRETIDLLNQITEKQKLLLV
ncbi:putative centrosomal protein [Crotalus adamanteus]|uniref:Centrosomal protein n=1 Tax=Crotalus adamanteus TaxID=8729 RepID=A0AAW1BP47_CROAD